MLACRYSRPAFLALASLLLLAVLFPVAAHAFAYTTYSGTYTLSSGATGPVGIQIARAIQGGWEGYAKLNGKQYSSNAVTSTVWYVNIFFLDKNYQQHVIATMTATLSPDQKTLSGPFVLNGVSGTATLTGK